MQLMMQYEEINPFEFLETPFSKIIFYINM